jgi:hypothetical protein
MIISPVTTIEQFPGQGSLGITGAVAGISVNGGPLQEGVVNLNIPDEPSDIGAYPDTNPNDFITNQGVVLTSGNQVISGQKTFVDGIQFGYRPTVNGTGVVISGDSAFIKSDINTGLNGTAISGADKVLNLISVTQDGYNALPYLTSGTLYIIV